MRTILGRLTILGLTLTLADVSAQTGTSRQIEPRWQRVSESGPDPLLTPAKQKPQLTPEMIARARSAMPLVPANAPNPRRNFGPFYTGSHLDAIKIVLNGRAAAWYYTDYLTQHAATKIRSYFPAGFTALSGIPTGAGPRHIPGTFPQQDGFNDLQLSLSRIRYSGRFGGSVELTFVSDETYEYDARAGTILWDFADVTLRMYVVPSYVRFNANPNTVGAEPLFLEFEPRVLAAYQVDASNRVSGVDTQDRSADLQTFWTATSGQLRSQALRRAASAFVYGYIHDLFADRLSGANVVAQMELDENFLDLDVRTGTPYVYGAFRASAIEDVDTEPGDEHLVVKISGCQVDGATQESYCGDRESDIGARDSTPYWTLVIFPLSQCNTNTHLMVQVNVSEVDTVFDDEFETAMEFRQVNCTALNNLVSQQRWGSSEIYRVENVRLEDADGNLAGLVSLEIRLSLENR